LSFNFVILLFIFLIQSILNQSVHKDIYNGLNSPNKLFQLFFQQLRSYSCGAQPGCIPNCRCAARLIDTTESTEAQKKNTKTVILCFCGNYYSFYTAPLQVIPAFFAVTPPKEFEMHPITAALQPTEQ
jgi:hypothetical protein